MIINDLKMSDVSLANSGLLQRKITGGLQLFSDYMRTRGSSKNKPHLSSFSSIVKEEAGNGVKELETVYEDKEEIKEVHEANDSEIKILITNPMTLTTRNQASLYQERDLANLTRTDDESFGNLSEIRINTTEAPNFYSTRKSPKKLI